MAGVADGPLRVFLHRLLADHEAALREWPAAQQIHHAYRGGLLEHVLTMARTGTALARIYGAREDVVLAGAIVHDIGKLQELAYDSGAISYTRDGNLVGHIALGLVLVRDTARGIAGFPDDLRAELEHLVLSHHGSRDRGSPVEPKSVEAFILAAVDELDARLHQVRQALQDERRRPGVHAVAQAAGAGLVPRPAGRPERVAVPATGLLVARSPESSAFGPSAKVIVPRTSTRSPTRASPGEQRPCGCAGG